MKKTEKIEQARTALQTFLQGTGRKLEIEIDCPIEDRIRFIYAIIFSGFKKASFYWRFFIARLASIIDYSPIKVFFYRSIGIKIGKGVFISPAVILDPHFPSLIEIDDYAIIGWGVQLFTHNFSGTKYSVGRIKIGRGAVIGAFSIVRGGVTVGECAQIQATCIVYKDVPKNGSLVSGIILSQARTNAGQKQNGRADF